MAIIATLVVGANNATSMGRSSKLLSTPPDRSRFLKRHRSADAFIIGKNSAASELYSQSQVPIFVLSRNREELAFSNPAMEQILVEEDLAKTLHGLAERISGDIVVEAGPTLLMPLLEQKLINLLELSISPLAGDGDFIDLNLLLSHFSEINEVVTDGTRLLECRY
jgi:dihydrofolate reductase